MTTCYCSPDERTVSRNTTVNTVELLNSQIPEIPPIKKKNTDTHHFSTLFIQFSPNCSAEMVVIRVWEFMGGNKSYFEIKRLFKRRCNLMGKKKKSHWIIIFSIVQQISSGSFSSVPKKPEDHLSVGNVQETFQGWLRETFSLAGWKVSFLRFDCIVRFHGFSKTFVCVIFSLLHEDRKPIVFNPHLWKETNQSFIHFFFYNATSIKQALSLTLLYVMKLLDWIRKIWRIEKKMPLMRKGVVSQKPTDAPFSSGFC